MRIGVFGGSFDPVHNGHLRIAIEALEQLKLDKVLIEVARQAPLKNAQAVASFEARRSWVEAASGSCDQICLGEVEAGLPTPNFTVNTLEAYAHQSDDIHLIIGADQLRSFSQWREPNRILELARLAVAPRLGTTVSEALRDVPPNWSDRICSIEMDRLDISSTMIRAKLKRGESIAHLVPDAILESLTAELNYK